MKYHKIQSLYKRGPKGEFLGEFSRSEFSYLYENDWIWTEKVDGTNVRLMYQDGKVTFGGRTDAAQMPVPLAQRLNEIIEQAPFAEVLGEGEAVLYGEGYGARIQKGGGNYKSDGVDFVLFDVRFGDLWLARGNVADIARKLGVDVVPIVGYGSLRKAEEFVMEGFKSWWGNFGAEGVVARPWIELNDRRGQRIITKLKTKDYAER